MLEYQARKEKSKPNKADEKFIAPETTGPITIAAKITCPMSLKISEKTFDFSEEIPIRVYYIIPKKAVNFDYEKENKKRNYSHRKDKRNLILGTKSPIGDLVPKTPLQNNEKNSICRKWILSHL